MMRFVRPRWQSFLVPLELVNYQLRINEMLAKDEVRDTVMA